MYIICVLHVYSMCTTCIFYVYYMYILCVLHVYSMCTTCIIAICIFARTPVVSTCMHTHTPTQTHTHTHTHAHRCLCASGYAYTCTSILQKRITLSSLEPGKRSETAGDRGENQDVAGGGQQSCELQVDCSDQALWLASACYRRAPVPHTDPVVRSW